MQGFGLPASMLRGGASRPDRNHIMAKGQVKSNKEVRKPKAQKPKAHAGLAPVQQGSVKGLENLRNK
jgi:hypothetical protein